MLSVQQGGIKYHFLSLWYDSTWDWILVSWTIGEHSTHKAKSDVIFADLEWDKGIRFLIANIMQGRATGMEDENIRSFPNGLLGQEGLIL